jgi:hypothetical protein
LLHFGFQIISQYHFFLIYFWEALPLYYLLVLDWKQIILQTIITLIQLNITAMLFHFFKFGIGLCFQAQNLIKEALVASIARWEKKRAYHFDSLGEESGFASSKDWNV